MGDKGKSSSRAARLLHMLVTLYKAGGPLSQRGLARAAGLSRSAIQRYLPDATDLCPALYQLDDGRLAIDPPAWRRWIDDGD